MLRLREELGWYVVAMSCNCWCHSVVYSQHSRIAYCTAVFPFIWFTLVFLPKYLLVVLGKGFAELFHHVLFVSITMITVMCVCVCVCVCFCSKLVQSLELFSDIKERGGASNACFHSECRTFCKRFSILADGITDPGHLTINKSRNKVSVGELLSCSTIILTIIGNISTRWIRALRGT